MEKIKIFLKSFAVLDWFSTKNKTKATGSSNLVTKNTNKAPTFKTRFHNINESFRNYTPEELEKIVKENQKGKFDNNDAQANKSESKQELRVQAIKNVNANTFLTVIEGDPFWEKQIEDEIERLSKK